MSDVQTQAPGRVVDFRSRPVRVTCQRIGSSGAYLGHPLVVAVACHISSRRWRPTQTECR
jgi:hypothetical protein